MLLELLNKHKCEPITEAKRPLYDEGKWQKSQQSLLQQVLCPAKMACDLNRCKQCLSSLWCLYEILQLYYIAFNNKENILLTPIFSSRKGTFIKIFQSKSLFRRNEKERRVGAFFKLRNSSIIGVLVMLLQVWCMKCTWSLQLMTWCETANAVTYVFSRQT